MVGGFLGGKRELVSGELGGRRGLGDTTRGVTMVA